MNYIKTRVTWILRHRDRLLNKKMEKKKGVISFVYIDDSLYFNILHNRPIVALNKFQEIIKSKIIYFYINVTTRISEL